MEEAYEMPIVKYLKRDPDDQIEMVKRYLQNKFGKAAADKRLRTMSGLQVLELADKLKTGEKPAVNEGKELPYTMPEIQWGDKP